MFKISKINCINIGLPLVDTIHMSNIIMTKSNSVIVRIQNNYGEIGWGEAAASLSMTGESAPGMIAAINYISEKITSKDIEDVEDIYKLIATSVYGNFAAKSAIEMALIDLLGINQKKPFYQLIGEKIRHDLPIIWRISGSEKEIENALKKRDEGFISFKIKVGAKDLSYDLKRAENLRKKLGDEIQLTADANGGYKPKDAITFSKKSYSVGLDYFEQPVAGTDLHTMKRCNKISDIPISADEGVHTIYDLHKHYKMKAAEGSSLKLIKFGSICSLIQATKYMEEKGMHINISGKAGDSSISAAAIGNISMVLPKLDWYSNVSIQYLGDDVVKVPHEIVNGKLKVTEGPGLGLTVDEEKLEYYKI
ncbi:MAG: mandelate racemase/muconate lactonizing enzyme family protein [Alphaproteobacteria bacterium]|jgi:L-alanine-DL-glutamate epimerase-like enolase superfamily enzyme